MKGMSGRARAMRDCGNAGYARGGVTRPAKGGATKAKTVKPRAAKIAPPVPVEGPGIAPAAPDAPMPAAPMMAPPMKRGGMVRRRDC
jgi:hypothetical protein